MNYNKKLGLADLIIQGFLLVVTVTCSFGALVSMSFILIAMFFLIFLGGYQFLGGVVGAIKGNKWKRKYLIVVIAYLLIGGTGTVVLEEARWTDMFAYVLFVLTSVVIPQLIAIGYFYFSLKDYQKYSTGENVVVPEEEAGVLDQNIF